MLFKLRPCIQKLCNVHYPPTPSLGWIGQIKGRSLSLASARSASWLVYSLHPRSLTPIWSWMHGCTKLMPTHVHPWIITSHPCPPKTHGHGHGYGHPMQGSGVVNTLVWVMMIWWKRILFAIFPICIPISTSVVCVIPPIVIIFCSNFSICSAMLELKVLLHRIKGVWGGCWKWWTPWTWVSINSWGEPTANLVTDELVEFQK